MIKLKDILNEAVTSSEMSKKDWQEFFKWGKSTDARGFKEFEKKYSIILDLPHVSDAMQRFDKTEFNQFYKFVSRFNESNVNL